MVAEQRARVAFTVVSEGLAHEHVIAPDDPLWAILRRLLESRDAISQLRKGLVVIRFGMMQADLSIWHRWES